MKIDFCSEWNKTSTLPFYYYCHLEAIWSVIKIENCRRWCQKLKTNIPPPPNSNELKKKKAN